MAGKFKIFDKIWRVLTWPFRKILNRILFHHDEHLEKKIRREVEVILSHELKTPLTGILAYSELLLDNLEDSSLPEAKENLESARIIHRKSEELVRFIDNVINASMLEFNPGAFYTTTVNLSSLVVVAINRFKSFFDLDKHVQLISSIDPDVPIYGNEKLLVNIVFELLSNSYIYRKDGDDAEIRVTLKKSDGNAVIIVEDNGIGIKDKYMARIFDKFFRVENADTAQTSGLGVGLTLVKKVVGRMKGNIDLTSKKGYGTKIVLSLPLNREDG